MRNFSHKIVMDNDMIQAAIEAGMSEDEAERAVDDYNYNLTH